MKVRCKNLDTPYQHPTRRGFKTKVDCYQTRLTKFPKENAVAHCIHEMLLWGIFEGDPTVNYLVPQPYLFYMGTKTYQPDLFYMRNGQRFIVEVKSEAGFEGFTERSELITEFLKPTIYEFQHITNESIADREVFARNWLIIVHTLVTATNIETLHTEVNVLDRLYGNDLQVGDIVDCAHRIDSSLNEIALYRLAHTGKVELDLEHERLNSETGVRLCR